MPPVIDLQKCNGCTVCDRICPLDVIYMDASRLPRVRYPDECWHCGSCRQDCPTEAISIRFGPRMLYA